MLQRWREVFSYGIEWQVFRVCPSCKGSGAQAPYSLRGYLNDPPEGRCHACSGGIRLERFKSTRELKKFINSLPDED
jgi:hypothetical protein